MKTTKGQRLRNSLLGWGPDDGLSTCALAKLAAIRETNTASTHRVFCLLMPGQWLFAMAYAYYFSPEAWKGADSSPHIHIYASIFLGGLITLFPLFMIRFLPRATITLHVIATAQLFMSALLTHLMGGRIETHFHVFGSITFLSFYRYTPMILTATIVTALDHLIRGYAWPQSVYGVLVASEWRWLEHGAWVFFLDAFLIHAILRSQIEMGEISQQQAELEATRASIEEKVRQRTEALQVSERNLYASEARYKSMVANTPGVVYRCALDRDWTMEFISEAIFKLSGYQPAEIIKNRVISYAQLIHSEDERLVEAVIVNATKEQRPFEIEYRILHKDGNVRWVFERGQANFDANGAVSHLDGFIIDVTKQKEAEALVKEQQIHLIAVSKNSVLGEMAGNIAHEINSPLGAISLNAEMLSEELEALPDRPENAVALVSSILKVTERISKIVKSLRALGRDGSQDPIEPTPLEVILDDTLSLLSETIKRKAVTLETIFGGLVGETIPCRSTEICQVLMNLVKNSLDAVENLPEKWIRIEARREGKFIDISVVDSGKAKLADLGEKLWELYYTTKPKGKGSGIGLPLSRRIARGHGGELFFDKSSEHTRFVLRLPLVLGVTLQPPKAA